MATAINTNTFTLKEEEILIASIQQVSTILKLRDLYTASHQLRVAELAVEIGKIKRKSIRRRYLQYCY